MQELARLLRGSHEKLEALRDARLKVERAIDDQEGVQLSTRTPPEKEKPDARPEEMPALVSPGRGTSEVASASGLPAFLYEPASSPTPQSSSGRVR